MNSQQTFSFSLYTTSSFLGKLSYGLIYIWPIEFLSMFNYYGNMKSKRSIFWIYLFFCNEQNEQQINRYVQEPCIVVDSIQGNIKLFLVNYLNFIFAWRQCIPAKRGRDGWSNECIFLTFFIRLWSSMELHVLSFFYEHEQIYKYIFIIY